MIFLGGLLSLFFLYELGKLKISFNLHNIVEVYVSTTGKDIHNLNDPPKGKQRKEGVFLSIICGIHTMS